MAELKVYRKYPNRTKKELLFTTSDPVEAETFAKTHDHDDSYETLIYQDGVQIERGI